MKLSNYIKDGIPELEKRQQLDGLINFYDFLSKASGDTGRASTLGVDTLVNSWIRQQLAFREQLLEDLIIISRTISEVASPILHVTNEVFRKGLTWEPAFAKKCKVCGKEYDTLIEKCTNVVNSEVCGSEDFRDPDEDQLEVFKTFVDDCNIFDQSLTDVLREFEESINSVDDAYLYLNKEYSTEGDKVRSKVVEIRHLRPSAVEFDLDSSGIPKHNNWLCVFHRDKPPEHEPGVCSECGRPLQAAMFKYKHRGSTLYFLDTEICHESKFHPSSTYGFPPILTVFEKALTLIGMDKTVYRYFFERKMPSSMLMIATDDTDSIRRARAEIVAQLRQSPDHIPMVGYSQKAGTRGRVDMVRLFHTLQEMDYLPVRQEIRERIAALWGLPPLWQAEYSGIGGLSGQSQQLVQFSRVVESDQMRFNDKVLPFIAEAFNITDWKLKLEQPEEKAEATRIQFAQQRVQIASMLKQLGFKIEMREGVESVDDLDFKVSGEMEEQQQMGGMGGEEMPFGMSKGKDWTSQIIEKGYSIDNLEDVSVLQNGTSALTFMHKGDRYVAVFQPLGGLIGIWNARLTKPKAPKNTLARKQPREEAIFNPDDADEPEEV